MPSTAIDFHRLLVHFPVALFLVAALFQTLAVWRNSATLQLVAKANLVTGAAIGIFTALFGYLASSEFANALLETHELIAFVTVGVAAVVAALWLWKPSEPRQKGGALALGGLALVAAGVAVTGYLGGDMAYGHGTHGPLFHAGGAAPAPAPTSGEAGAAGAVELPPDLQSAYATFAGKCSACHGLDRPLQIGLGADAWPGLVREMADKAGGAISVDEQATIVKFLQYYSVHRTVRLPAPPR
jgi:uncharacterized membrane protein